MKHWLSALVLALLTSLAFGQQKKDTLYPFQKAPTLYPFKLQQADSSIFSKEQLKKGAVLLMYFSPSCDHCQHQVKDMLKRMDEFKHVQFVLATYQPFDEMTTFIKDYKLAQYDNVHVGRDKDFKLPPFYHMENLPFLALYDKKGSLITTYSGNVAVDTLLKAFQ